MITKLDEEPRVSTEVGENSRLPFTKREEVITIVPAPASVRFAETEVGTWIRISIRFELESNELESLAHEHTGRNDNRPTCCPNAISASS